MSQTGTIDAVAQWAQSETQMAAQDGGIWLLIKKNMALSLQEKVVKLFDHCKNWQIIRIVTGVTLENVNNTILIALQTSPECKINGVTAELGRRFDIRPNKATVVTSKGDFLFAEFDAHPVKTV